MDVVTHSLSGLAVAQLGFRQRLGRVAVVAATAGALAPDLDSVMAVWDQFAVIRYHRGLTHSFAGGAVLTLLLAWPIWRWDGRSAPFRQVAGLVYLGILAHIGLDLITSFGIRPFLPMSDARLAWDLAFIVDPLLTATLALPLLIGWRRPRLAAPAARIGLAAMVVYLASAAVVKAAVLERFTAELRGHDIRAERVEVLPRLFSPWRWMAVGVAPDALYEAAMTAWPGAPWALNTYPQPSANGFIQRSDALEPVRLFRAFSRFPVIRYIPNGKEHVVEYRDLRFGADTDSLAHGMVLRVVLDAGGSVLQMDFNHRF